jgi:hypothetical protein
MRPGTPKTFSPHSLVPFQRPRPVGVRAFVRPRRRGSHVCGLHHRFVSVPYSTLTTIFFHVLLATHNGAEKDDGRGGPAAAISDLTPCVAPESARGHHATASRVYLRDKWGQAYLRGNLD